MFAGQGEGRRRAGYIRRCLFLRWHAHRYRFRGMQRDTPEAAKAARQGKGGGLWRASGLVDILSFLYIKCDFTGLCVLQSGYDRLQRADEADEGS